MICWKSICLEQSKTRGFGKKPIFHVLAELHSELRSQVGTHEWPPSLCRLPPEIGLHSEGDPKGGIEVREEPHHLHRRHRGFTFELKYIEIQKPEFLKLRVEAIELPGQIRLDQERRP